MPSGQRYLPGDPSDLLLRKTQAQQSEKLKEIYIYLESLIQDADFNPNDIPEAIEPINFKIIIHIVQDSVITDISNFSSQVKSLITTGFFMVPTFAMGITSSFLNEDKDGNELPIAGINVIDGSDITQIRTDLQGRPVEFKYSEDGVTVLENTVNNKLLPGVTLDYIKSLILPNWDPSKYINIILVNNLLSVNPSATKRIPIGFHTENPFAVQLNNITQTQAITFPFWVFDDGTNPYSPHLASFLYGDNYNQFNLPTGTGGSVATFSMAFTRFFGILNRSVPTAIAGEDEFFYYALEECSEGCFYKDGKGNCEDRGYFKPTLDNAEKARQGDLLLDCVNSTVLNYSTRDFDKSYSDPTEFHYAYNSLTNKAISQLLLSVYLIIDDESFILKSLADEGKIPLTVFGEIDPEPVDPFLVTWDCSVLGNPTDLGNFPVSVQEALENMLQQSDNTQELITLEAILENIEESSILFETYMNSYNLLLNE